MSRAYSIALANAAVLVVVILNDALYTYIHTTISALPLFDEIQDSTNSSAALISSELPGSVTTRIAARPQYSLGSTNSSATLTTSRPPENVKQAHRSREENHVFTSGGSFEKQIGKISRHSGPPLGCNATCEAVVSDKMRSSYEAVTGFAFMPTMAALSRRIVCVSRGNNELHSVYANHGCKHGKDCNHFRRCLRPFRSIRGWVERHPEKWSHLSKELSQMSSAQLSQLDEDAWKNYSMYKYCESFPERSIRNMPVPILHQPGVALYLQELDNIGHQSREVPFLARAFRLGYHISAIVQKHEFPRTREHFDGQMQAHCGKNCPPTFHSIKDVQRWLGKQKLGSVCFDRLLQKERSPPGDFLDYDFHRQRVYRLCEVGASQTHALLIARKRTRSWANVSHMSELIREHTGLPIVLFQGNGNFCQQVSVFAKARLMVGFHGAEIEGNGVYLRPNAGLVEVLYHKSVPRFERRLAASTAVWGAAGIHYHASYSGLSPSCRGKSQHFLMHTKKCKLVVNETRFVRDLRDVAQGAGISLSG